ncbi:hypothetical protein [Bradyrhizobium sp. ARR65]|uniref:hypothetical protein n=1 Tax=Bradyrhizobium sp. ARR65 TaxID=1040989 RepID=UPI0004677BE0|nr:hypothetical protein [Bradyrhizobium sp. ARR65]
MYRIYFDANERVEDGYGLWLNASKEDMGRIPNGPQDGMRVIIYMTGELEMEAILAFMPEHAAWTARPVPRTTKYLES